MKMLFLKLILVMSIVFSYIAYADFSQKDPTDMVKELSDGVLNQLVIHRADFEAHPSKAVVFAEEYILPYVDTYKMSRYVMGRKWKQASKQQQTDFVDAFTKTILNSYASSLIKLQIEEIDIVKTTSKRKGRASVETEVTQSSGEKTKVVYRLFQNKKDKKWFIYDFAVEGISLLVNYRKSFSSEISKKGLDQVITDMQNNLKTPEKEKSARGG